MLIYITLCIILWNINVLWMSNLCIEQSNLHIRMGIGLMYIHSVWCGSILDVQSAKWRKYLRICCVGCFKPAVHRKRFDNTKASFNAPLLKVTTVKTVASNKCRVNAEFFWNKIIAFPQLLLPLWFFWWPYICTEFIFTFWVHCLILPYDCTIFEGFQSWRFSNL